MAATHTTIAATQRINMVQCAWNLDKCCFPRCVRAELISLESADQHTKFLAGQHWSTSSREISTAHAQRGKRRLCKFRTQHPMGTRAYRSGQRLRFVTSRSRVRIGVAASFFVEAGGSSDSADSEHDGLEWFGNVELDSGCVGHDNRPSGRISARLGLHGPMPV